MPNLLPLPPEIAAGGISQIAGTVDTIAFAVKDGNVIVWGAATHEITHSTFLNVPASAAGGGQVVKVDSSEGTCVALLADGTLVEWGYESVDIDETPGPATISPIFNCQMVPFSRSRPTARSRSTKRMSVMKLTVIVMVPIPRVAYTIPSV